MTDRETVLKWVRDVLTGVTTRGRTGNLIVEKGFGQEVRLSFEAARLLIDGETGSGSEK